MVNINYLKRVCTTFLVVLLLITLHPMPINAIAGSKKAVKDEKTIVVSMGDSFSSGEGIEPFYDQDKETVQEKVDSDDWLAHRSEKSWPGMLKVSSLEGTLANYKDKGNWYFVASSGAVTADIMGTANEFGEIKGQRKDYNIVDGTMMVDYLPPQIEVFNYINREEVDYVTLTLGGNDAGFTKIIVTAAKNGIPLLEVGNLNTLLSSTLARADVICDSLETVYKNIADAAPNASIIVADYPKLLDPRNGSVVWFSKEDAVAINNAVEQFSERIKETVEKCASEHGISIHFVSVIKEFEGHESYRDVGIDYINGIYTQPKDQDLVQSFMEASSYSMHPNENGAKAYARCVQAKIDELEGLSNVTCLPDLNVSVFAINGKLYDDYKIKIKGKEYVALWGLIKKDYNKTIRVTDAAVQHITLPEGRYEITITDGDLSYVKNVKIDKKALQDALRFETDFGYQYGYEEDANTLIPVTSDERDIVLVLDNSGSMSGTPIEETRKASENFINTVLQQDASIGIVAFESEAHMLSNFSMDEAQLVSALDNLYASGGTNTLAGLSMAGDMLEQSGAKKKIIVVMSDGRPSNSQSELAECAKELRKKGIVIYALGFFDHVGDNKASAQAIMETIADDGCHYEVEDVDNLVFFFEDIADQISGQQYIYIKIACPVEVTVEYEGEWLCSEANALNTRTNFGTLTFEERTDGERVKILRLKQGTEYDIRIEGTGDGRMNYTIGLMDENGEYSDMRKFYNVKITDKTIINTVASESRNTVLQVDEDGDGKLDIQYKAGENSRGEIVKTNSAVWIIPLAMLILIASATLIVLKKKNILIKKG